MKTQIMTSFERERLYEKGSCNPKGFPPTILDYRIRFLSYYMKQDDKSLLDVSCGKGQFLNYYKWKGLEVEGTEIDEDCIKQCESKGVKCKRVDLNTDLFLPYNDNSFDIVSCTEVIEHIKYPKAVIEELVRVSKNLVLITTPKGRSYFAPDHVNFWHNAEDLSKLFKNYDYEINQIVTKVEDYPANQRCFVIAILKNNHNNCPICNTPFGNTDDHKMLFQCPNCKLYKTKSILTKEFLMTKLKGFLLSACFDQNKFKRRLKKAKEQLDSIEFHISKGRVFDIGCGPAFFLKVAKDSGWQVEGNDISLACVNFAKEVFNIDIHYKFIDEIELKEEYYTLFNIWNALEHLIDPVETLKKVYKSLKYGGVVNIRVPNRNERTIKDKYEPDHTYKFNDENLALLLKNIGFELVTIYKHDGEVDFLAKKER